VLAGRLYFLRTANALREVVHGLLELRGNVVTSGLAYAARLGECYNITRELQ
jgi:hypothetical protein